MLGNNPSLYGRLLPRFIEKASGAHLPCPPLPAPEQGVSIRRASTERLGRLRVQRVNLRCFVPRSPVELPAPGLRSVSSPLLEEERGARLHRLLADVPDPPDLDGTVACPGLPAHDHPVDPV